MPKKQLAEALIDLHRRLSTLATRSHERRKIMPETANLSGVSEQSLHYVQEERPVDWPVRSWTSSLNRPRAINDARMRSVKAMFNPLKGNAMSTTLDGFCHRMVRVGDVNIHAVIGGDGPPLVLLHGFPQTWWAWRKMMPLLAVGLGYVNGLLTGTNFVGAFAGRKVS